MFAFFVRLLIITECEIHFIHFKRNHTASVNIINMFAIGLFSFLDVSIHLFHLRRLFIIQTLKLPLTESALTNFSYLTLSEFALFLIETENFVESFARFHTHTNRFIHRCSPTLFASDQVNKVLESFWDSNNDSNNNNIKWIRQKKIVHDFAIILFRVFVFFPSPSFDPVRFSTPSAWFCFTISLGSFNRKVVM